MTTKYTTLIVAIVAIASVGAAFALSQDFTSPQNNIKSENMKSLGHIQLVVYGADGAIKGYRQTDNLVVTNGDNVTANRIFGTTLTTSHAFSGAFNYIGVGTSSTAPAVTQTDLSAVASAHRLATVTNGAIHGTAQVQVTFPANRLTNSSAVGIQESGLFDAQGNGTGTTNMFARQTFSSISVNPADTLQVTWTVTIT
jgi:hypothetical protein